jgi:hypothetical protein
MQNAMKGRVSFEVEFLGSLCSRGCKHLGNTQDGYGCNLFGRELHTVSKSATSNGYPIRLRICERADFTITAEVSDER